MLRPHRNPILAQLGWKLDENDLIVLPNGRRQRTPEEFEELLARGRTRIRETKAKLSAARQQRRAERRWREEAEPCGAMTRKGTPCKRKPVYGKKRCANHGGLSTGPKTEEGKERIREGQRKRWERVRAEKGQLPKHSQCHHSANSMGDLQGQIEPIEGND